MDRLDAHKAFSADLTNAADGIPNSRVSAALLSRFPESHALALNVAGFRRRGIHHDSKCRPRLLIPRCHDCHLGRQEGQQWAADATCISPA
jgi:hypothetical protein